MNIESIRTFFLQLKDLFVSYDWLADTLDIVLVALIVYGIIKQLRKSQSIQIIKGIILVSIIYIIVVSFNMKTSSYIFSKLFSDIIVLFAIIFSKEIRQALESVGKSKLKKGFSIFGQDDPDANVEAVTAVSRACGAMSRSKVGSLIIFQRNSFLGDLTKGAVSIDAETTYEMLCSIFYPKAPLHDGAIIIKNGRIVAARCVVPMTNGREISDNVGTRHRAAIEISLNSDAVVVVTSEETGLISVAVDGQLKRGFSESELNEELGALLLADKSIKKVEKKKRALTKGSSKKETEKEELADVPAAEDEENYLETPTAEEDFSSVLSNEGDDNDEQE